MNKYFLPLLLVSKCLFCQVEETESHVLLTTSKNDIIEFTNGVRAADSQWRNEEKEKALLSYSALIENSNNPLFTAAAALRKGILALQLGHEEEASDALNLALAPLVSIGRLDFDELTPDEIDQRDRITNIIKEKLLNKDSPIQG